MQQKYLYFFTMLALLFGCAPIFAHASSTPDVIIAEVAWAGSSISSSDEWLELANVSDHSVDVSGFSLTGTASAPLVIPAGSVIASHSTYLIANYDNTNSSSTLSTHAQTVTTLVSLPNDKLRISLLSPTGSVVDSAGNGGTLFAGKSGGTGSATDGRYRTMERRDFLIDGKTKEAWQDADTSNGFKDGVLDLGTPGSLNPSLLAEMISLQPPVVVAPPEITPATTDNATISPEPVVTPESEAVCEDVTIDANTVATDANVVEPTQSTTIVTASVVQPIEQPIQTTQPQGTLRVSEIFPHPATGESEWVELENPSMYPVVTNGWSILDASNAATVLPDGVVNPGSFLVIENPKGRLNNDGDSVIVKDATGSLVESVMYNADLGSVPNEGESLVRVNASMLAISTTPTKGVSNVLTPRAPKVTTTTTSNTSNVTNTTNMEPAATNADVRGQGTPPITGSDVSSSPSKEQSQIQPLQTQPAAIIKTIRLSELYPNTGGNDATDEFIEIENTGDTSVSLDSWSLSDQGGTKFLFAKDTLIAPHTFKVFLHPETNISLNNSGDTISLTAPDGSVVDTQTYEQAKPNLTYARTGNVWNWTTTLTPNEPNIISGSSDPVPATTLEAAPIVSASEGQAQGQPLQTQSNRTNAASLLTIDAVKQFTNGTRVKVHGIVTALPNTFNSQTMYIQDDTGGIQIFKSDCRFPTLVLGQSITVSGVLSHTNGEARIKVTNQKSLVAGSVADVVTPSTDTASVGSLMTIAGMVMSRSNNRLALNVDGETWNVDLPKTNTAVYRTGSHVQVSGILSKTKSGNVLKARSEQDVIKDPKDTVEQPAPNVTSIGGTEPKQTLAIVLILLASLAFFGLKLRPHLYSLMQSYGRKTSLRPRS